MGKASGSKPGMLKQGMQKLRAMRPAHVRREMQRPFSLFLLADGEADRQALIRIFIPETLSREERERALECITAEGQARPVLRVATPAAFASQASASEAVRATMVDPENPEPGLAQLLRVAPRYRLALARTFPPLRERLARELIRAVAGRNASIAALSAISEVFPTPLSLILALGEMGSDTVLITANQMSLAFQLAAVRGADVGWRAQSRTLLAIAAGGVGWRALAREAVGLIPAGVGLAAKTTIAYSGTMMVGTALWRVPKAGRRRFRMMPSSSTGGQVESRLASRRQTA